MASSKFETAEVISAKSLQKFVVKTNLLYRAGLKRCVEKTSGCFRDLCCALSICLAPRFAFGRIVMDSSLPQKTLDKFFKIDLRILVSLEFLMGRVHQCHRMTSAPSVPSPPLFWLTSWVIWCGLHGWWYSKRPYVEERRGRIALSGVVWWSGFSRSKPSQGCSLGGMFPK